MCIFSQENGFTRKAEVGEELVLTRFLHSSGFATGNDPRMGVCVPHGMKLELSGIPVGIQRRFSVGSQAVVTIRETPDPEKGAASDGIFFPNGDFELLRKLPRDIRAKVLPVPESSEAVGGAGPVHEKKASALAVA